MARQVRRGRGQISNELTRGRAEAAYLAHNQVVGGSSPSPATNYILFTKRRGDARVIIALTDLNGKTPTEYS